MRPIKTVMKGLASACSLMAIATMIVALRICPYPDWMSPKSGENQFICALMLAFIAGALFSLDEKESR